MDPKEDREGAPGHPLENGLGPRGKRLDSWKDIAAYIERDVRTVQRWEKAHGLPVHRHLHGRRSTPYAFASELDTWWEERRPHDENGAAARTGRIANLPRLRSKRIAAAGLALAVGVLILVQAMSGRRGATPQAGVERRLTFTGQAYVPVWSPDGRYIAYIQDGAICLIAPEGGSVRNLEVGLQSAVAWGWTRDSKTLIVHGAKEGLPSATFAVDLMDESVKVLVENGVFADVSPDGRILAYSAREDRGIWLLDLDSGAKRRLVQPDTAGMAVYKPKWSPDGSRLTYMRWTGLGPDHELWTIRPDGSEKRQVAAPGIWLGGNYAWSPDGKSVVIAGEKDRVSSIWRVALSGRGHRRLTTGSENQRHVSLAPDGTRFVFGNLTEASRILVFDMQSGRSHQPIELAVAGRNAFFSSDGSTMIFEAMVHDHWQLWQADVRPGGQPRSLLALEEASCFGPVPGENGSVLYLRSKVGRVTPHGDIRWSQSIWRTAGDGGRSELLSPETATVARLAPSGERDGRILYATEEIRGTEAVWILGRNGHATHVFSDGPEETFSAFDWGRQDTHVLLALAGPKGLTRADLVAEIDLGNGERSIVVSYDELEAILGARPRSVLRLALSRDRTQLGLLVSVATSPPGEALVGFDLTSRKGQVVHQMAKGELAGSIAWSPDGQSLALDLARKAGDLFVWEPDGKPEKPAPLVTAGAR